MTAIVIFAKSVIINGIFAIRKRIVLDRDVTFRMSQCKCKYANHKPIHDFLYDGNSNIFPIFHHLQDIHHQNYMTFTLTFSMGRGHM